ncbi:5-hydroxytryptamine receptor 2C-like [Elysia marginata]|uniref:5-hydroxytryptamine receptor 2C-like n=1 Tax=Elysia marginata TaxID=1093978 RepID=A0AAV4FTX1_9GAST|nr:5-hydroxytryptamine receptor 2C-like [Elysia marginata]
MHNSSFNGTSDETITAVPPREIYDQYFREHVAASVGILIVLLGILINGLILGAFSRDIRLQVVFNYYVYNLAITDVIQCFMVLNTILYSWLDIKLDYNSFVCLILECSNVTLTLQEFFLLHLMSRDRYLAVKRGLTYRRKTAKHSSYNHSSSERGARTSRADVSLGTISLTKSGPSFSTSASSQSDNNRGQSVTPTQSVGGMSRDTTITHQSNFSSGFQSWVHERTTIFISWFFSAVLGFFIADVRRKLLLFGKLLCIEEVSGVKVTMAIFIGENDGGGCYGGFCGGFGW